MGLKLRQGVRHHYFTGWGSLFFILIKMGDRLILNFDKELLIFYRPGVTL